MSKARGQREVVHRDMATFLRDAQATIIHEWEDAALSVPRAQELDRPTLIDFIPRLLDGVADMLEDLADTEVPEIPDEPARKHAEHRLEEGYDLDDVIVELALLRDTILRIREAELGDEVSADGLRLLNRSIDRVMISSARQFTGMRDRLLVSLDRVSQSALYTRDFNHALQQLIEVFRDETAAVDAGAILLREDDVLRVCASTGSAAPEIGAEIAVGEGFTGTVAASGREMEVACSDPEPLVDGDPTCAHGMKAVYGIPLVEAGQIIGVAQMASLRAPSFSLRDRALFASMATRAAAAINQQILREDAERRARELRDSELRFRSTFEAAALGIAHMSPNGKWVRLNKRYCEILGRSEEELLEISFQEVTHPDDLPRDMELLRQFQSGELQEASYEKRYIQPDGAVVWVRLMMSAIRDDDGRLVFFIAAASDISEQKRLADRLAFLSEAGAALASSLEYRTTLERVAQLAVGSLADGCIVDIVEPEGDFGDFAYIAHNDPSVASAIQEMRRLYPPRADDPAGAPKVLRTGEADIMLKIDPNEVRAYARDPVHLAMLEKMQLRSLIVLPLEANGRRLGAITLLAGHSRGRFDEIDVVTARELATRAAIAIENARLHREAKRAVELRDRVLAIVAHDLRSPLTTINLSSSVVRKTCDLSSDPQAVRAVEVIERNVVRSKRLIDDLLDMSSIQSGQLSLDLAPCEITSILTESVDQFSPIAHERGVALIYRFAIDHATVRGDRDRLVQVLSNLLGNAIKFCSSGDRIELRASKREDQIVIEVEDTGVGIAAEHLPQIFELYWRGEKRVSTGLGLFIARGIVAAHGGRIEVESEVDRGTTFTIILPQMV